MGASVYSVGGAGFAKPESSPVWTQVIVPIRKVAHYTWVNDEVLANFSNFAEIIGQELLAGLVDAENARLLTGGGQWRRPEPYLLADDLWHPHAGSRLGLELRHGTEGQGGSARWSECRGTR